MSAIYDFNDKVAMTGTLTKIDWRNPHIELDVESSDGAALESWALEGPSPSFFRTRDINKSDSEAALNKTVMAEASRARDVSRAGLLRTMTLPEEKSELGMSPELLALEETRFLYLTFFLVYF